MARAWRVRLRGMRGHGAILDMATYASVAYFKTLAFKTSSAAYA
jgi:hypothetical protein